MSGDGSDQADDTTAQRSQQYRRPGGDINEFGSYSQDPAGVDALARAEERKQARSSRSSSRGGLGRFMGR
jgi:hypothetical protein